MSRRRSHARHGAAGAGEAQGEAAGADAPPRKTPAEMTVAAKAPAEITAAAKAPVAKASAQSAAPGAAVGRQRHGGPRPGGARPGGLREGGTRSSEGGTREGGTRPSGPRPIQPRRQPKPRAEAVAQPPAGPRPQGDDVVVDDDEGCERKPACTLAQMRRFIKSRPYVPVHELRRRFEIEGIEDEVNPVATDKGTLFVGLPAEEAAYLGDLIKAGEVGYELLLDPTSPAVVGVFPMRPVARQ